MTEEFDRFHVILSGCSGGGKSTLLAELASRGYGTVAEPGRRIIAEQLAMKGRALPWIDLEAFARRAIEVSSNDMKSLDCASDWVFFDRGLIDAAAALEHAASIPITLTLRGYPRFHRKVFLTPPWPEIFLEDGDRKHDLDECIREYHRLIEAYYLLKYEVIILPKTDTKSRADFVVQVLAK